MARSLKTHIKHPRIARESLCGRTSVGLAKERSKATCKTCHSLAVDGTLAEIDAEMREAKAGTKNAKSGNSSGRPILTEKQLKFAAHPEVTTNTRKAAREAGYSESFARTQSTALRRQLAPLIMENQERTKKASAISAAKVQTELAAMGFANVIDYFNIADDGSVMPKQLNELTRNQAAAIQEVEVIPYDDPKTGTTRMVIGKIKLADKRANLVDLGKSLGMFNRPELEDKRESALLLEQVPTKALEDAEALLLDAVAKAKDLKANNEAIPGECKVLSESVESEDP